MNQIFLNGAFVPQDQACISVMDRGFLFGDGVYEVIPAYGGLPFRLKQHLERLTQSLQGIGMEPPLNEEQWTDILEQLLSQRPGEDQQIYLQITRGAYDQRAHPIPENVTPTIMAMATALLERDPAIASEGLSAVTIEDIRWHRCNIKAITLLPNILSQKQAREEQAQEAILVRDGLATEGSASNLFMMRDNLLITPPNSEQLLPGITRDLVLELAQQDGIPYTEAIIPVADLATADEIWLTSSTREVMPITRLNQQPVGNGEPGPMWRHMNELYTACKARLRMRNRVTDECR